MRSSSSRLTIHLEQTFPVYLQVPGNVAASSALEGGHSASSSTVSRRFCSCRRAASRGVWCGTARRSTWSPSAASRGSPSGNRGSAPSQRAPLALRAGLRVVPAHVAGRARVALAPRVPLAATMPDARRPTTQADAARSGVALLGADADVARARSFRARHSRSACAVDSRPTLTQSTQTQSADTRTRIFRAGSM